MNKISIILPIYNVENFLPQCLNNVINQTHKTLEIILVNDGSADSCPQICENYAAKDHRIKVIHQKNGGLSDARNAGLKVATGDFISFVDSDDLLALDFCQKLLDALFENNADIAECNFLMFEGENDLKNLSHTRHAKTEIFKTEKALELLIQQQLKQVVWNKIYRSEVIQDLQFPVGKINEDEFWTYKVFGNATKVVQIPDALYFYRQQEGSIMGKKYSIKRLDGLQALEERISYMKSQFPQLENLAIQKFCLGAIWHYQQVSEHQEIDPQKTFRNKIVQKIKQYNHISIYKNWNWKDVFWYQLFLFSPKIGIYLKKYNDNRIELSKVKNNPK